MNQSRLEQLLRFHEEDPSNPFNIYASANENKSSDNEKALSYFEILIKKHPCPLITIWDI